VVYFYEGNDIDDNVGLLINDVKPPGGILAHDAASAIDAFLRADYAKPSPWACHGHFGDMLWRMARYEVKYGWRPPAVIDLPGTINPVTIDGATRMAGEFQAPPILMSEAEVGAGVAVFARSLAWLRGRFPDVPVAIVYVPSPPTVYRAAREGAFHVKEVFVPSAPAGPTFRFGLTVPASQIYARSQLTCEKIGAATVAAGADFIDARPAFRAAAAKAFIHGPRDWNHPNELGYRTLGALVAARLERPEPAGCDDRWPE
jgi:hypothetical protein